MPHCTTNFAWYLGKFLVGFAGVLFLYVGFLKENERSCVCDARMRELLRQESEKRPSRCECARRTRNERYPCGCIKTTRVMQDDERNDNGSGDERNCTRSRCCVRRSSH